MISLVQALYDYSATIEEEFDFKAGDVIAVTPPLMMVGGAANCSMKIADKRCIPK